MKSPHWLYDHSQLHDIPWDSHWGKKMCLQSFEPRQSVLMVPGRALFSWGGLHLPQRSVSKPPGLQASAEGHATPEPSERPGPAWPRRLGQRFLHLCPVISSNNNWSLVGPGSQWIEYSDVRSHHFRTFGFSWSIPCPLLEDSEEVYFPLSLKPVTFFKALNKIGENSFLLAKE